MRLKVMNRNVLLTTNMVQREPTVALVVQAVSVASMVQAVLVDLKISSQVFSAEAVLLAIQTLLVKVMTSSIASI